MNPPEPITSVPLNVIADASLRPPVQLSDGTPIEFAAVTEDNTPLYYKTTEGKNFVCCPNCGPVEIGGNEVPRQERAIDDLAMEAAAALREEYEIGNSSGGCDEWDWDSAEIKDIAAVLRPFFAKLI